MLQSRNLAKGSRDSGPGKDFARNSPDLVFLTISLHAKPTRHNKSSQTGKHQMCSGRNEIQAKRNTTTYTTLIRSYRSSQASWLSMYHRTSLPAMTCGKLWGTMTLRIASQGVICWWRWLKRSSTCLGNSAAMPMETWAAKPMPANMSVSVF